MRVCVVGAGLFGSVIATALRAQGHAVTVVGDQRSGRGSLPAACLMRPQWAGKMPPAAYAAAIAFLRRFYTVQDLEFDAAGLTVKVQHINPREILIPPDDSTTLQGWMLLDLQKQFDRVVLATGSFIYGSAWEGVEKRGGWAYLFPGQLQRPFIRVWAPYKQIVAFNIAPDRIWVGDGTSLVPGSMTDVRERQSALRCAAAIGRSHADTAIMGYRPYVRGLKEPALLRQVRDRTWLATGGAKNGTLGAAWAAEKLCEEFG
jgi:hypothetical protein